MDPEHLKEDVEGASLMGVLNVGVPAFQPGVPAVGGRVGLWINGHGLQVGREGVRNAKVKGAVPVTSMWLSKDNFRLGRIQPK